jgi:hypothetical protein
MGPSWERFPASCVRPVPGLGPKLAVGGEKSQKTAKNTQFGGYEAAYLT